MDKFQVWLEKDKKMIDVTRLSWDEQGIMVFAYAKAPEGTDPDYINEAGEITIPVGSPGTNPVRRFTGIKDQNYKSARSGGQDVFEGDIVQWSWHSRKKEGEPMISLVEWDKHNLQWSIDVRSLSSITEKKHQLIVIGNKWEHPYLLNPRIKSVGLVTDSLNGKIRGYWPLGNPRDIHSKLTDESAWCDQNNVVHLGIPPLE